MKGDIEATKAHCKYCFQVLQAKLKKEKIPEFPKNLPDYEVPIFVTWLLDEELRGCIGTFSPEKLSRILSQYALISALQDDRFDPISLKQVGHLSVGVSFLVNFKPDLGPYDWQVGKHGIILKIQEGRQYSATFLPQVAEQQKWDKKTTLKYLMQKAGYNKSFQHAQNKIKITTYQSSKAKLTYQEYQSFKQ